MELHISKNIEELSIAAADWMLVYIDEVLQKRELFTVALSGGSTPKKLYELLASEKYKNKIDWSKVHIFFGDERFVPFADERNNARIAYDTLFNYIPVAGNQIYIMQTENISPVDSAKAYEQILHQYFNQQIPDDELQMSNSKQLQTFDLILLGMGDDGHTLSLFPGEEEVIRENERWCISLWLESQSMYRITLTHPVANNAACISFLVSGAGKAKALREVLKGSDNPELYPSQIIKPVNGKLHWFVDDAAAAEL
jgi:6-phosphogluconolactonase